MRTTALGPPLLDGRSLSIEIAGMTDRPNTAGSAQLSTAHVAQGKRRWVHDRGGTGARGGRVFGRRRGWTVEDDPTAGDGDAVVPIALREVGHRDSWEPAPLRDQLRDAVAGSRCDHDANEQQPNEQQSNTPRRHTVIIAPGFAPSLSERRLSAQEHPRGDEARVPQTPGQRRLGFPTLTWGLTLMTLA